MTKAKTIEIPLTLWKKAEKYIINDKTKKFSGSDLDDLRAQIRVHKFGNSTVKNLRRRSM